MEFYFISGIFTWCNICDRGVKYITVQLKTVQYCISLFKKKIRNDTIYQSRLYNSSEKQVQYSSVQHITIYYCILQYRSVQYNISQCSKV